MKRNHMNVLVIISLLFLVLFGGMISANPKKIVSSPKLHDYKIVRVIDGDTVEIDAPYLPLELRDGGLKLRILGIDTPEKGHLAKCTLEAKKSMSAKSFVEQTLSNGKVVKVWLKEWDKYGGRVLGDVVIDGKWLSAMLINAGYAIRYDGGKKQKDWCK